MCVRLPQGQGGLGPGGQFLGESTWSWGVMSSGHICQETLFSVQETLFSVPNEQKFAL